LSNKFDDKFNITHRNFDKVLEEIFEKMRELEDEIKAIPIPETEETPSSSSSSMSESSSSGGYGSLSGSVSDSEK
jgi:uncharacterized membrane protein